MDNHTTMRLTFKNKKRLAKHGDAGDTLNDALTKVLDEVEN